VHGADFLKRLDETIARHALLSHPFYQQWNAGALSRETLCEYAKQYYAHVRYFPRYVSAAHAACDDIRVRQLLLENLTDEDAGESNHPELWMRFADGLGVARDAVRNAELLPQTGESVATMVRLTRSEDFRDGLAALYAYESQVPMVVHQARGSAVLRWTMRARWSSSRCTRTLTSSTASRARPAGRTLPLGSEQDRAVAAADEPPAHCGISSRASTRSTAAASQSH
jgi:hypothetical protein